MRGEQPFLFRAEERLHSIGKGTYEARLLTQNERFDVIKSFLPKDSTFYLDSAEEWPGFEFLYILKGRLRYLGSEPPVVLGPGDYIVRQDIEERAWFKADTEVIILSVSSPPAFPVIREEIQEFLELAKQVEADEYVEGHCKRLEKLALQLGLKLGLTGEQLFHLSYAAFFHDIGKARVPREILQKQGELTEEEWEIMKKHTIWGREILERKDFLREAAKIVEQTHEGVDGKGYPYGLKGDEIRLEAKIISVVDAYDAMTSDRPYRRALSREEAIEELKRNAGTQFDAEVVEAFLDLLEQGGQFQGKKRFDEAKVQWGRQRALLAVVGKVLAGKDIEKILSHVVRAITHYTPFQRAALALYDQPLDLTSGAIEEAKIKHVACSGLSPSEEETLRAHPLPPESRRKVFSKEFRISRSYYIPHDKLPWRDHPGLIKSERKFEGAWHPADFLCIPLWLDHERILGIISVDDPIDGRIPTRETLEFIETFAGLAALAIQRAQDEEEMKGYQGRLKGVYELSRRFAHAQDLDELIKIAVEILRETFRYEHVVIFLKEGKELVLRQHETLLPQEEILLENFQRLPLEEGICGWVARNGRPALVEDVRQDPRYVVGHPLLRSELAVPIPGEEEVLGVISLESTALGAFTQKDLELLQALADQLGIAMQNLRRQEEQAWTTQFLQELNEAKDLHTLLERVLQRTIDLLRPKANAGSVLMYDEERQGFEFVAAINRNLDRLKKAFYREEEISDFLQEQGFQILTRTLQLRHPATRRLYEETGEPVPGSTISLPIRDPDSDSVIAFFNLNHLEEEGVFTEEDLKKLEKFVPEIVTALLRARDQEKLRIRAMRDALTNVYNRHYLHEVIQRELGQARRCHYSVALLMIDFDNFYQINNRYGHLTGDRILRESAQLFQQNVREGDIVVRYGGDEFLILLPYTSREEAERIGQRLKECLSEHDFQVPERIAIEIGVAEWDPRSPKRFEEILEEADRWMYRARRRK